MKGESVSSQHKPAVLETGLGCKVPGGDWPATPEPKA